MTGIRLALPFASYKNGFSRSFYETDPLPSPAMCYGFLLSMVGEYDRHKHKNAKVCPGTTHFSKPTTILRKLYRQTSKEDPNGSWENNKKWKAVPEYQQLLTNEEIIIWIDSSDEKGSGETGEKLEQRIIDALKNPSSIKRAGGLSLGESQFLVDSIDLIKADDNITCYLFLLNKRGRYNLPVWVDHVGSKNTRFVCGNLMETSEPPDSSLMPVIQAPEVD